MIGVVRSELGRLSRRSVIIGWFGLTAALAMIINVVMFQVIKSSSVPPANGPGVSFPSEARLLSEHGIVAGLGSASSILGVVALSFWAIATSTDYSTGLIRVLASAQPVRWRLILGKWLALGVFTAAATTVALVANLVAAPLAAQSAGYSPSAWGNDLIPLLLGAWINLFGALLIWGTIGLALATLTRSSGVAIGVGVGYVLLGESLITSVASSTRDWLPGTTMSAIASGGTAAVSYGAALSLGVTYLVLTLAAATIVVVRRDITD
ncbi:hypothetical protein [Lapillicoccus sp.]|uniref:hypothetical protein n=1 Tax=Lapillicoccus sp. TaxID=1909287 RepID=UPI0025E00B07|nr:hypothetical protein [Lapillicoccus sp.]